MKKIKCACYSTKKHPVLGSVDFPCDRPAKFIVSYLNGVTKGKVITENRCLIHKNALIRGVSRVKKLCGFDSELTITPI